LIYLFSGPIKVFPEKYFLLNKHLPHFTGYRLDGSDVDETYLKDKVVLLNFMFIGLTFSFS